MSETLSRRTVLLLAPAALAACASRPPAEPVAKPVVRKIAVVPATDPRDLSLDSRSAIGLLVPIAGLAALAYSKSRQAELNLAISPATLGFAEPFSRQVAQGLAQAGFEVQMLDGVARPADDPDGVDLTSLGAGADAVLHLRVTSFGLYAGLAGRYEPVLVTYGLVNTKPDNQYLTQAELHYGAHARKGKDWAIEADPAYAYADLEEVKRRADHVRQGFLAALQPSAERMVRQLVAELR